MTNCLSYALHFWKSNPKYKIVYNSDHVINIPQHVNVEGFLHIESFGYGHLSSSFKGLLSEEDLELLREYLKIK